MPNRHPAIACKPAESSLRNREITLRAIVRQITYVVTAQDLDVLIGAEMVTGGMGSSVTLRLHGVESGNR